MDFLDFFFPMDFMDYFFYFCVINNFAIVLGRLLICVLKQSQLRTAAVKKKNIYIYIYIRVTELGTFKGTYRIASVLPSTDS